MTPLGSFLGITDGQVRTLFGVGVATIVILAVIARPLLFASIDPAVAAARGVPVRALSVVFLVRFLKTRLFLPSGLMLALSLAAAVYFGLAAAGRV